MQIINHILYFSWEELEVLGVPHKTIHIGTMRARKGAGRGWLSIQDPSDKRRCLVQYDSIPANTVKACALPSLAEMLKRHQEQLEKLGFSTVLNLLPAVSSDDLVVLRSHRVVKEVLNPATGELCDKDMGGLPEQKIQEYLAQGQWLALLLMPAFQNKDFRKKLCGANTYIEACDFITGIALKMGVKLPSSYRQLSEKLNDYRLFGAKALIHASFGNKNAQKLNEVGEAALLAMYSHKNKPSAALVHSNYERVVAEKEGLKKVSVRTVQRAVSKPENAQQVSLIKDGYKSFNNKYGHETIGKRPSYSDALHNIDGTKVNLAYKVFNSRGKAVAASKLKMVVVMDCYSDAFIGWYISENENVTEISGAVRNAIIRANNVLPGLLISDQDGTNKVFFKRYTGQHSFAIANHGQSKYIERAFGHFQDSILRGYDNFTGMNITAKSNRSRINMQATGWDETLGVSVSSLPTLEEVYAQIEEAIRLYNHTPNPKTGKSRWQKYTEGKRAGGRVYTEADELQMFFEPRKQMVSYTKSGIVLETAGVKTHYEVYKEVRDGIGITDLEFHSRYVSEQFIVKADIHGINKKVALFIQDAQGNERFIAWAEPKVEVSRSPVEHNRIDKLQLAENMQMKKAQLEYLKGRGADMMAVSKEFGFELEYSNKEAAHKAYEELESEFFGWNKASTVSKGRQKESRISAWAEEPTEHQPKIEEVRKISMIEQMRLLEQRLNG